MLGAESWTRNVGIFDLHMGGLDRKVGGLDRAWTAFGSPVDWLGQRFHHAWPAFFFPAGGLAQRFHTASSAFGRPFDGLGQGSHTDAGALWGASCCCAVMALTECHGGYTAERNLDEFRLSLRKNGTTLAPAPRAKKIK